MDDDRRAKNETEPRAAAWRADLDDDAVVVVKGAAAETFRALYSPLRAGADVLVAAERIEDDEDVPLAPPRPLPLGGAVGMELAAAVDAAPDIGPDNPIMIPPAPEDQESDDDEDANQVHLEVDDGFRVVMRFLENPDDDGHQVELHADGFRETMRRFEGVDTRVHLYANGFREAVRLLEYVDDRRPIDDLHVGDIRFRGLLGVPLRGLRGVPQRASLEELERDEAESFPRFVELLGQREGGRNVRRITLHPFAWTGLPDDDMKSLFRNVLPGYPDVNIDIDELDTKYLRVLTDNIPTEGGAWPLTKLKFHGAGEIDDRSEKVRAIVDMLNRKAAIPGLFVFFTVNADQCKRICQALPHNTNLLELWLDVENVFADTLDGVAASSLQGLTLIGDFADDVGASLARQLRTNETLQSLSLCADLSTAQSDFQALLDLVRTYNYTLLDHDVEMRPPLDGSPEEQQFREQFEEYLRRNAGIRNVLTNLKDPFLPAVPTELLPRVLGRVSDIPTAVYRIMKMERARLATDGDRRGIDFVQHATVTTSVALHTT